MNKPNTYLVSIIIVNWNGGEILKNCLISLKKSTYPYTELIVVDNGSTDGTQSQEFYITLGLKVALINNDANVGFASANNQGYKKTEGEYILLLNNDTIVTPNFLTILVDKMDSDANLGVVQPKIYMLDKKGYLDNAGSFLTRIGFLDHWGFRRKDSNEFDKEREIFSAKGACMLIRRSAIEKLGLFDQDFVSYFEESDLCWRVWLLGYKVLFYPKAKIYHKIGFTIRRQNVLDINYHYYKNRICSLIKNLEVKNLLIILSSHLFISLGISFVFLVRGNIKNSFMILQAITWNVFNLSSTLTKRVAIQDQRNVKDSYLFVKLLQPINWSKFFNDFKRVEEDIKRKENA